MLNLQRLKIYTHRARQFFGLIIDLYQEKQCQKSAASLTYVTLFALVPLMTVTYAMFSAIPAFHGLGEDLQEMIFAHVVPETGQELLVYLQEFSEQARRLTLIGVAFLVVSAYLMLVNIEKNFNAIWGVSRGRKGIANFLLYWAVLSLGPLLLGVGLAMSTYLVSVRLFVDEYDNLGLLTWLLQLTPLLLTCATFTLLFAAVPNCKVPLGHAVIGGVVTAILFEALKIGFGLVVSRSAITLVYGAFAIVPLFLMWVNLIWMIILGGAVLVRTIGNYQVMLRDRGYPDLLASLLVLWHFYQAATTGSGLTDRQMLNAGLSTGQWQRIRRVLENEHVIVPTNQGDLVLCRDLHLLSLRQLAEMLELPNQFPHNANRLEGLPWYGAVAERLGAIDRFTRDQLDASVASLFDKGALPSALKA